MMALPDIQTERLFSDFPVFTLSSMKILPPISLLTALLLSPNLNTQLPVLRSLNYPHVDSPLISLITKFLILLSWFLFPFVLASTETFLCVSRL
jgi:hypothetical protein